MPLTGQLQQSLKDVEFQCELMQAYNESLRAENSSLRSLLHSSPTTLPLDLSDEAQQDKNHDHVPACDGHLGLPGEVSPQVGGCSFAGDISPRFDECPNGVSAYRESCSRSPSLLGGGSPPGDMPYTLSYTLDETISQRRLKKSRMKRDSEATSAGKSSRMLAKVRMHLLSSKSASEMEALTEYSLWEEFRELQDFFLLKDTSAPLITRIEQGPGFKLLCALMIMANTIYIAIDADSKAKEEFCKIVVAPHCGAGNDAASQKAVEIFFVVWFTVELMFRAAASKRAFIYGEDRSWNVFDALLVLMSIVELAIPASGNAAFSILRIFRVFRLVRVVRVVRTVPALKSLRTMVFAVLNSFVSLLWAFAFIFLMLLIFGIIFVNAVTGYVKSAESEEELENALEMQVYFGSLYETMVSLACSVTGGNDWMQYGDLLRKLSTTDIYFLIFAFYIFFVLVGLLNVVTGIFVDSAVCTRTEDEVVQCFREDQKRTRDKVRRIFKDADVDSSGYITLEELESHLEDDWVRAYFSGLDLDPSEACSMFTLMDVDCDGKVQIDEFVDGCMKLKGYARSIDVLSIMYDNAKFFERFASFVDAIQNDLRDVGRIRPMVEGLAPERVEERDLRHAARAVSSVDSSPRSFRGTAVPHALKP